MDDSVINGMAESLLRQLESVFDDPLPPPKVQVVLRPIVAWPDGEPGVWIVVNWPN